MLVYHALALGSSKPNICTKCKYYKKTNRLLGKSNKCSYDSKINSIDGTLIEYDVDFFKKYICKGDFFENISPKENIDCKSKKKTNFNFEELLFSLAVLEDP